MKALAIIITAYNAEKYIIETINAFKQQEISDGWVIKFYIGVDACYDTAKALEKNNIPYYFSNKNVGTYILTNSLLYKAQEDNCNSFLRFDSDDIPCDNFLLYGINGLAHSEFVRPYRINCDENLNPKTNAEPADGPAFFTVNALKQLGGYDHYRVACDGFFRRRAEKLNLTNNFLENVPTYFYRHIQGSLTKSKETGKKSQYRKNVKKQMLKLLKKNICKIENPSLTSLQYIKK